MHKLTSAVIDSIFKKLGSAIVNKPSRNISFTGRCGRRTAISNHFERGHDCNITPEKICYDDGNSLLVSLYHYQRRTSHERERLDRTPEDAVDYGRRWFWNSIWHFLKDPVRVEFLFSAVDFGLYAGKARSQITTKEYRARKYDLPDPNIGKAFFDKILKTPMREFFLSLKILFATEASNQGEKISTTTTLKKEGEKV